MAALPLTGDTPYKEEMKYHGKFGHTPGRIQHIDIMNIIDICYATCCLSTQTVAPTLPGYEGINRCVKYLAIHQHKLIFYPSKSYGGSIFTKLTWSGNQVEYYTAHIF